MADTVTRTIVLKAIKYRSGRKKGFVPLVIHKALNDIWNEAGNAGELLASIGYPEHGLERHCFMNHGSSYRHGFSFQYCTYVPGEFPQSAGLDFKKKNVDVEAIPVKGDKGNVRQVVSVTHVLAFGNIFLVENCRGNGGMDAFERYITSILRKKFGDEFPTVELTDAVTRKVHDTIKHGGGAKAVELALTQPNVKEGSQFAESLSTVQGMIPGADQLVVKWESDTKLSIKKVEDAFHEADDNDAFDRVTIHLNNGETLSLSKYRIRKRIKVQAVQGNNPASSEVVHGMRKYLLELMDVNDGMTILTKDGNLSTAVINKPSDEKH